jgi:hypothetical protein
MSTEDPWKGLEAAREGSVNARRIDETTPWDLYWARDSEGRCLLLLNYEVAPPHSRLPALRGLEIEHVESVEDRPHQLVLRLLDGELRDVFVRLCRDVIAYATRAKSESDAVAAMIARTWRWHHLLRGGRGDRLSREEQKGLLGELLVLETYFIATGNVLAGVAAWRGPSGAPQDFVKGGVGLESKASTTGEVRVKISSEFQLDDAQLEDLYIHITTVDPASMDDEDACTLAEMVDRVRRRIRTDVVAEPRFEGLLSAAGFRDEDDYSTERWTMVERSILRVNGRFPRITTAQLSDGVGAVRYELDVSRCTEYMVSRDDLLRVLGGEA